MSYPPLYFTLTNRLNGKYEYGQEMESEDAAQWAKWIRDFVLNKSEYKVENRERWHKFCGEHPGDLAASFVAGELGAGVEGVR